MANLLQEIHLIKQFMDYNHTNKAHDDNYSTMVKHIESMSGSIDSNMYVVPVGILNKSSDFNIYDSSVANAIYAVNKEMWTALYDLDLKLDNFNIDPKVYEDEKDSVAIQTVGKDALTIMNVSQFICTYIASLKNGASEKWIMDNLMNSFTGFEEIHKNLHLVPYFDARLMLIISDILRTDTLSGLRANKMLEPRFSIINDIYNTMIQNFYKELYTIPIRKNSKGN